MSNTNCRDTQCHVPGLALSLGFTLIELMVVVAIMSVSAALIVPAYARSMGSFELRRDTREMVTALRLARSRAIVDARPQVVTIDSSNHAYSSGPGQPLTTLGSEHAIGLAHSLAGPPTVSRLSITFHPDGSSTGGSIVLARGALSYHIEVDWLTGRTESNELN